MSSDSENETIREFVLKDSINWDTASAVYLAYPLIRDDVYKRFLEHLYERIWKAVRENGALKKFVHDIIVDYKYDGERRYQTAFGFTGNLGMSIATHLTLLTAASSAWKTMNLDHVAGMSAYSHPFPEKTCKTTIGIVEIFWTKRSRKN